MTPYEAVLGLIVATFIVSTVIIITGICALGVAFIIGYIEKQ